MLWTVVGWIAWVIVLLLSIAAPVRLPDDEETDRLDAQLAARGASGAVERRVLGWLLFGGCLVTLFAPISKLHLIWWPFGAWILWLMMNKIGPKLLLLPLVAFWIWRFWILGWEAMPGNLRAGAMLMIAVGGGCAVIGPSRSLGLWSRRGGVVLFVTGLVAFLGLQFF